jgi:cell division protein FtsZ
LEQPTSFRRGPATSNSSGSTARKVDVQSDPELDYLDVPAFLRKQAD